MMKPGLNIQLGATDHFTKPVDLFFFFNINCVEPSPQAPNKSLFSATTITHHSLFGFFVERSTADLQKDRDLNIPDSGPDQLFYVPWHWLPHKSVSPEAGRGAHTSSIYLHS